VPDPVSPHAAPTAPYHLRLREVTARSNIDLDLPAGSRTVIVGPSGSGKTTLVALLGRLLDPVAGSVTLNGTDLRERSGAHVRSVVGIVDEHAYMFDASIAANLRVGSADATDAQMHEALRRAHIDTWGNCPRAWTRRWGSTERSCPAVNADDSHLPGLFLPTTRSSCLTNPQNTWTNSQRGNSSMICSR
jgi:ABC-type dipeptide/oligopeptide/nickel transport system ATPase component